MRKVWTTRYLLPGLIAALLVSALIGCSLLKKDRQNPTMPNSTDALSMMNFFASRSESSQYEWSQGNEVVCVNIPVPGDYHLTYYTTSGSFHIVFRADQPARLYIGLEEGDEASDVELEQGSIPADAAVVADDGIVKRFATPTEAVQWDTVFPSPGTSIALEETDTPCEVVVSTKNMRTSAVSAKTNSSFDRDAHIAAIEARKAARKTAKEARKAEKQARKEARKAEKEARKGAKSAE